MRAVFVGASSQSIMTVRSLLKRGHEVVIIERDKQRASELTESLDCGVLFGDGSRPAILKEADPPHTDLLFCLTGDDQANILASLVGRSLGFKRVVTRIEDPELEHVCLELGLEDTIIPARTIGHLLTDKFEGRDPLELSTMIRDNVRIYSFILHDSFKGGIRELELPEDARVICIYRKDKLIIPDDDTRLAGGDDVVIIIQRDSLPKLKQRWGPEGSEQQENTE